MDRCLGLCWDTEKAQPNLILGPPLPNPKYGINKAQLPFTERYKHLLYVVVILVIAGLVFLQYRVFRRID